MSILTIGNFDGVHLGHLSLLRTARELADAKDVPVKALTFHPHPVKILRPGFEPPMLMPLHRRIEALRAAGADEVIVLEPTPAFMAIDASDFITSLVHQHHPSAFVEGPDFSFGRGRSGNMKLLAQLGVTHGFSVTTLPETQVGLTDHFVIPVRSTHIRGLVGVGRVADAALCLGRHFELEANVVLGEQRGRKINIPTANLDNADLDGFLTPGDGVYAGLARLPDGSTFPAAISVGVKPTFGVRARTIEAHLLNHSSDLYGQTLRLSFTRWLRDQQVFPNLPALIQQLERDILLTRRWHERGILHRIEAPRHAPLST